MFSSKSSRRPAAAARSERSCLQTLRAALVPFSLMLLVPHFSEGFTVFGARLCSRHSWQLASAPPAAAEVPVADPTMPIDEAKAAALALAHTKDSARLPDIVKSLEKQFSSEPIHTVDFFNLAISGEWDVVHSTLYPKRAPAAVVSSEDLTVHSLRQTITPSDGGNPRKGEITTAVEWELPEQGITGTFEVVAQYLTGDNSSMKLTTTGHRLKPSSMPRDPQGLVELLQRHMPFELFDPDEQAVFTTYVDHDMRIVWAAGGRTGPNGSRIIFLRHHSQ
eukprot:TRINITY_DN5281_c0_g2_i1.p1 TRINITY_DN5281_c0_g2~~TRINITY_DN5281_c0_g2_i1.p1  ORF type:complete len:278 (-),score=54.85 TRINITY_DN5281_c0_g2_i1:932-1765(-)